MTTPIKIQHMQTQHVTGVFAGSFYATLEVNKDYEAPWITPLLENIANNLTALEGPDWRDRVSKLIRALNPQDALLLLQSEVPANGLSLIVEFFRRVPLLTKDQVIEKLEARNSAIELDSLMKVTFADTTLYVADHFADDGSVRLELIELMNIFRRYPNFGDWNIASWWINPTGWLSGNRPRDVFMDDFDAVNLAAEQEILYLDN